MAKPALGRGLGALLGGAPPSPNPTSRAQSDSTEREASSSSGEAATGERVQRVPLNRIQPCGFQPRKTFSQESLQELADSIQEQGILQPLLVRPKGDHFELIAGERRWRAAQMLELDKVPVLVRHAEDQEALELALIENLQRDNLNPLEEALGYSQLIDQFHLRQEDVATKVGKSRTVVANALRLLKLPPETQTLLRENKISVGHAKVILALPTPEERQLAAECVVKDQLNVRQTEEMVALFQSQTKSASPATSSSGMENGSANSPAAPSAPPRDSHIAHLEDRLRERLGTKVRLQYRKGKGSVQIRFFNDDDLHRLLQTIGVEVD